MPKIEKSSSGSKVLISGVEMGYYFFQIYERKRPDLIKYFNNCVIGYILGVHNLGMT